MRVCSLNVIAVQSLHKGDAGRAHCIFQFSRRTPKSGAQSSQKSGELLKSCWCDAEARDCLARRRRATVWHESLLRPLAGGKFGMPTRLTSAVAGTANRRRRDGARVYLSGSDATVVAPVI